MAPSSPPLTAERILEATEEVLRRHGPAKATVVDVARALGVSHGSVYRHFRTKAALRQAVTRRWLDPTERLLAGIVARGGDPEARLREWFVTLFEVKRDKAGADPELFATYMELTDTDDAVSAHLAELTGQLTDVVRAGVEAGVFVTGDPAGTAHVLFLATGAFHDPGHVREWANPGVRAELDAVLDLLLRGLRA
ncbi:MULTISPECIES: TetR family transcriptional regulator [unclassified Streptomyces]|uniref:TetR family transcriptional regulator n=1 Tax=unclassified Streptomyces TaxID=2593676 RepID=UPI00381710A9